MLDESWSRRCLASDPGVGPGIQACPPCEERCGNRGQAGAATHANKLTRFSSFQPPLHPGTPPLLPLAAAAAARARRKARAAARLAPRVGAAGLGVKAFVCGVRWGVRLTQPALESPATLAAALDAALADDGVACGSGDLLGVLMLGRDGRTHAFGRDAGKAGKAGRSGVDAEAAAVVAAAESWEGWGVAASTAARLYVSGALVGAADGAAAAT